MNKEKYLRKIQEKFFLKKGQFRVSYCWISNYQIKLFHVKTLKHFREFVEPLNFMDDYCGYLLKPQFIFELKKNQINFDIVVLNQNLKISKLYPNCQKNFKLNMMTEPKAILILNENSISFLKMKVDDVLKLSKNNFN